MLHEAVADVEVEDVGPTPLGARHAVGLAVAAQATAVVPLVLLGTMAVGIRRDLGFDESAFGITLAVCFASAALFSALSGRIAQRVGPSWGVRIACLASAGGVGGFALVASSWVTTLPQAVLIGFGVAMIQPATDLLLARSVPVRRQGMAFGLKQTAGGPAIGLVAGLAVPLVAGTVGWRAAFLACAAVSIAVVASVPGLRVGRRTARARPDPTGPIPLRPLLILAAGGLFGTVAQSAFVAFAVSAAVAAELTEGAGGVLFAAGSAIGCATRVVGGHLSDRRSGGLLVAIASMMALAVVGFAMMATESAGLVIIAVPLLCATAWGWPGLYFLAVSRVCPGAPARASGIAAAGLLTGGILGPLAFGFLARDGYRLAWLVAGAFALVGALGVLLSRRSLSRSPLALASAQSS